MVLKPSLFSPEHRFRGVKSFSLAIDRDFNAPNWFKLFLVDDPEPSQEPDVMEMDIINIYLLARFRVMVLGGVMLLA